MVFREEKAGNKLNFRIKLGNKMELLGFWEKQFYFLFRSCVLDLKRNYSFLKNNV